MHRYNWWPMEKETTLVQCVCPAIAVTDQNIHVLYGVFFQRFLGLEFFLSIVKVTINHSDTVRTIGATKNSLLVELLNVTFCFTLLFRRKKLCEEIADARNKQWHCTMVLNVFIFLKNRDSK